MSRGPQTASELQARVFHESRPHSVTGQQFVWIGPGDNDQAADDGTTRTPSRIAMQKVEGSSPFIRF
jgi:hypothetical protein